MAKKKKYYVVWHGNNPGIYDSWADCQLQINGFPGAVYKSFKSRAEAEAAYSSVASDFVGQGKSGKAKPKQISEAARENIVWKSIAVDAACSGNPGDMEYRGVDTATGDEIFRQGPFAQGTNNVGEFLALVHALAYLKKTDQLDLPIYSDSRTAMSWVRKKKVNTNLKKTARNQKLFELIDRGLIWLKQNSWTNPILKWKTDQWGEIPADFGRK